MARGWESKSVESQMEAAESRRKSAPLPLTQEQIRIRGDRERLELSRTRVLRDMEAARHPRHREQLALALKELERRLAALDG